MLANPVCRGVDLHRQTPTLLGASGLKGEAGGRPHDGDRSSSLARGTTARLTQQRRSCLRVQSPTVENDRLPGDSSGVHRRPGAFGLRSSCRQPRPAGEGLRPSKWFHQLRSASHREHQNDVGPPDAQEEARGRAADAIVISQAGKGPWHLQDARAFFLLTALLPLPTRNRNGE
jgi:hypothetical protein